MSNNILHPNLSRKEKAIIMDLTNHTLEYLDQYHFKIQSMTNKKSSYLITLDDKGNAFSCSCPDHNYRLVTCKHMLLFDKVMNT